MKKISQFHIFDYIEPNDLFFIIYQINDDILKIFCRETFSPTTIGSDEKAEDIFLEAGYFYFSKIFNDFNKVNGLFIFPFLHLKHLRTLAISVLIENPKINSYTQFIVAITLPKYILDQISGISNLEMKLINSLNSELFLHNDKKKMKTNLLKLKLEIVEILNNNKKNIQPKKLNVSKLI